MSADRDLPATPATEARMLEIVFPDHTNHLGTLFGGQALAWMDKAAFIAASRDWGHTVVTAARSSLTCACPSIRASGSKPSRASTLWAPPPCRRRWRSGPKTC